MIWRIPLLLGLAFNDVRRRAARSCLTALSIMVSVTSLIVVVALIQGMSNSVTRNFDQLGSSVLTLQSQTSFADQMLGRQNRITYADFAQLSQHVQGIRNIVPAFFPYDQGVSVTYLNNTVATRVLAVTPRYQDTYRVYPVAGRFFTDGDEQTKRKVCVIGDRVREGLKLGRDAVGKFITINGTWLKVVGLMERRGEIFGISQDDYIAIPFATGEAQIADPARQDISVAMNVVDMAELDEVKDRITRILRTLHHLRPGEPDDFLVATAQQLSNSVSSITGVITAVFGAMLAISMLVGGIGIMNIMLASVGERVKEIGICKAIGANRSDIILQFLAEAGIIATGGGIAGLALGTIAIATLGLLFPALSDMTVPVWLGCVSVTFSLVVGLVFGVIPAIEAAALDPIEALYHD